uniref:RNase H type-1 domain-containing protein n=1 Tax=Peronospora matthiolae TaxID=2874970 RepID=A0AAV1UB18_9STRA
MATTSPDIRAAADVAYTAFEDTLTEEVPRMSPLAEDSSAVLFFNGGSRGNPGPGGAEAIIIITNSGSLESAGVRWMCSVSLAASTTTHNAAAYKALLFGLRKALGYHIQRLHVVGYSDLILGQLRCRRPSQAQHLKDLYRQCRLVGDRLGVATCTHHLRHFNKMANALAKISMDSGRSIQVLGPEVALLPPEWAVVTTYLRSDLWD